MKNDVYRIKTNKKAHVVYDKLNISTYLMSKKLEWIMTMSGDTVGYHQKHHDRENKCGKAKRSVYTPLSKQKLKEINVCVGRDLE